MEELRPADSAEALGLFRAQVLGPLLCRESCSHGELSAVLREIAAQPVLPPGAEGSLLDAPDRGEGTQGCAAGRASGLP